MWRQWIVPIVLTALTVAGFTVLALQREPKDPMSYCYTSTAGRTALSLQETECTAYNATYKVALIVESVDERTAGACPFGPYHSVPHGRDGTLCLSLNVRVGDCLQTLKPRKPARHRGELVREECGPRSESKVTTVATGPQGGCASTEKAIYYSQPATTICLGKP